jgi:hypothetical protein
MDTNQTYAKFHVAELIVFIFCDKAKIRYKYLSTLNGATIMGTPWHLVT